MRANGALCPTVVWAEREPGRRWDEGGLCAVFCNVCSERRDGMTNNAASAEAGGVLLLRGRVSERWIARLRVALGVEQVVPRHAVVEPGDLVSVARLEEVEDVFEEVMDLDDGVVAELWQREIFG